MEYRVLGPVEAAANGRALDLGGPLERALLARLLLAAGRAISLSQLVGDLWQGDTPDSAQVSIRVRVSRLRKTLAAAGTADAIRTEPSGYALRLGETDCLDASRFVELVRAGRSALKGSASAEAARLLDEALSLWRGPALEGLGELPFAQAEAARLEEERLGALGDRIEARLAMGEHAELLSELETLCARHPLHERLWAQRATALYRSGRQGDALAAVRRLREVLREELGIDPSAELVALERRILKQAPDLAAPAGRPPTDLPRGVVTFLLTDIERSAELWDRHPGAMAMALERHEELVARAVADAQGHLLKSRGEGDATLSVFQRASNAVVAAAELRRLLDAEPWPDAIALRVRIALHTGEAHERDGDFFGPALNRAARIRGLARGGQALLSNVTVELVRDALPEGAALVDAGEHALRGLARGERVFELVARGTASVPSTPPGTMRPPLPDAMSSADAAHFVGRQPELERLQALWREAAAGTLRLAFVAGEPGIGKTRLAARFASSVFADGAVVLAGRCDEVSAVPYQPFVEALRHLVSSVPREDRAQIPGADELLNLIPELASSPVAARASDDPEVARYRLFEAVSSVLGFAASAGPAVLVLDDLHWADRPTLLLMRHVLRAHRESPLLVIGTYRESDLGRTRPFVDTLADLRRERAFQRIVLRGLGEDEVVEVLEQTAQHEVGRRGRALARALVETTEGNPFFIDQVLDNLLETGQVVRRDGRLVLEERVENLGIPEGVREAVGRRLSRLSDECNRALAAASVLGREFDADVLTRMLERDPDEVLGAVEEAMHAGLVRELPAHGRARCAFSHALVQQALYEELPFARTQRLHLRAATAIEETYAQDLEPHVTRLARHLRAGGPAADAEKAIEYSMRAMEAAWRVFAFDVALSHGEAALDTMGSRSDPIRRASLLEQLGQIRWFGGAEHERSVADLEAAQHLLETVGDDVRLARVHIRLGRAHSSHWMWGAMDIPRALDHLAAAERLLGPTPDPRDAARLAVQRAWAATAALDIDALDVWSRRAVELGTLTGDGAISASGTTLHASWLLFRGQIDEGLTLLRNAWEEADRIGHAVAAWSTAWTFGVFCLNFDPRAAYDFLCRELDTPREAQAVNSRRGLLAQVYSALIRMGELERAREVAAEVDIGRGLRSGPPLPLFTGQWHDAEVILEDAVRELRRAANLHVLGDQLWWLGYLFAMRGATDMARNAFSESLAVAANRSPYELAVRARLAMLDVSGGGHGRAHLARCAEIIAQGNGWRARLGEVAVARGAVAAAAGEMGEAERAFSDAAETFRRYTLPWDQAEALHRWGRALLDHGERSAGTGKLDAALDIYRIRGAGEAWSERVLADRRRVE